MKEMLLCTENVIMPTDMATITKVDPETGMIINIVELNKYIQEAVMSVLDHKNIDKDVPFFKENVSTMENVSVFIWNSMKEKVGKLLYEIKLHETDKNVAWYRGET